MGNGRGPVAVALVFFVGACVAAYSIGTPPRSLRGPAAADSFLATWRQSRMATFVVDDDFTRTLPDGNVLRQTQRLVQRPLRLDAVRYVALLHVRGRAGVHDRGRCRDRQARPVRAR